MKVINYSEEEILLLLESTAKVDDGEAKEEVEIILPKDNIIYWYPLNMNYEYKFSDAKQIMYLTLDSMSEDDSYSVKKAKRAKPLPIKDGVPYKDDVFLNNRATLKWGRRQGFIDYDKNYNFIGDNVESTKLVLAAVTALREKLTARYIEKEGNKSGLDVEDGIGLSLFTDEQVYQLANKKERAEIKLLGEVYTYLRVMYRANA
ncbi:anti-sigma factor [Bacillus phage Hoody T]|uniref:Gp67 N-terminal domain-containing protein n=1 Tax=Bacillus phage Hoody T TaxID=1486660 RepID=A0A024B1A9_9CAUD|nr:anti-sigma factor [Bacillus phage Hoody T]AHZ10429.1 hypothetical protein [Bacillus phage Hoody T]